MKIFFAVKNSTLQATAGSNCNLNKDNILGHWTCQISANLTFGEYAQLSPKAWKVKLDFQTLSQLTSLKKNTCNLVPKKSWRWQQSTTYTLKWTHPMQAPKQEERLMVLYTVDYDSLTKCTHHVCFQMTEKVRRGMFYFCAACIMKIERGMNNTSFFLLFCACLFLKAVSS